VKGGGSHIISLEHLLLRSQPGNTWRPTPMYIDIFNVIT
jgi:hypothetical protein